MKTDPLRGILQICFSVNERIENLTLAIKIPMMIIPPPDIAGAEIDSFRKIILTIAVVKIKTLVAVVIV